jgi:hypothetical protein
MRVETAPHAIVGKTLLQVEPVGRKERLEMQSDGGSDRCGRGGGPQTLVIARRTLRGRRGPLQLARQSSTLRGGKIMDRIGEAGSLGRVGLPPPSESSWIRNNVRTDSAHIKSADKDWISSSRRCWRKAMAFQSMSLSIAVSHSFS